MQIREPGWKKFWSWIRNTGYDMNAGPLKILRDSSPLIFAAQADPCIEDWTGASPQMMAHISPQISDLFAQVL